MADDAKLKKGETSAIKSRALSNSGVLLKCLLLDTFTDSQKIVKEKYNKSIYCCNVRKINKFFRNFLWTFTVPVERKMYKLQLEIKFEKLLNILF